LNRTILNPIVVYCYMFHSNRVLITTPGRLRIGANVCGIHLQDTWLRGLLSNISLPIVLETR
jgi:hypothetical protein